MSEMQPNKHRLLLDAGSAAKEFDAMIPELEQADLIQATEHQVLSPSEAKLTGLEQ